MAVHAAERVTEGVCGEVSLVVPLDCHGSVMTPRRWKLDAPSWGRSGQADA